MQICVQGFWSSSSSGPSHWKMTMKQFNIFGHEGYVLLTKCKIRTWFITPPTIKIPHRIVIIIWYACYLQWRDVVKCTQRSQSKNANCKWKPRKKCRTESSSWFGRVAIVCSPSPSKWEMTWHAKPNLSRQHLSLEIWLAERRNAVEHQRKIWEFVKSMILS